MLKSVNIKEAAELVKSNNNIKLLDIRSKMEINMTGAISGSILIDLNDPESENIVSDLDKENTYLLYCASGSRSALLAQYMSQNGFKNIYNLNHAGHSQLASALSE